MFTGIIEETGTIKLVDKTPNGIRLQIAVGTTGKDLKLGDSLAVNGCCLTVATLAGRTNRRIVSVDLLEETWQKTSLQWVTPGSLVNLERPLQAGGRLDGHIVTGHVEGTGRVTHWAKEGADWLLEVAPPAGLMKYFIPKGSITIDGISLTVAKVLSRRFRVWIIPHTYQVTNLKQLQPGSRVSLETDLLGKYVERLLEAHTKKRSSNR